MSVVGRGHRAKLADRCGEDAGVRVVAPPLPVAAGGQRPAVRSCLDRGLIRKLGRPDIELFLQPLAYLEHCGKITALSRSLSCRKAHHALR